MNEKKICFISCVNDHQLYKESLYYINQLEIPEGYEIECICVEDAISMTQGYNKAMKESDAKYKVYLHQDVYIINKSFIRDVLDVFNSDNKVGMLGMAGAKTIPTNGVWEESTHKYGEVYESHTGKMELLQLNKVESNYEEVKVIDGFIIITQYDIPWREDIFDGWYFYDVSQSIEFASKGYKVVIPEQEEVWCIHDCGILNVKNGYESYRNIFLEEYSKIIINNLINDISSENKVLYDDVIAWRNYYIDNAKEKEYVKLIDNYLLNELNLYSQESNELFDFDKIKSLEIVNNNKHVFNKSIYNAKKSLCNMNYEEASIWCFEGAKYACENHPGFYTSPELERILAECAINININQYNIDIPESGSGKRKVLHVLSEGYSTGGHTRLVKNWIQKDKESIHSLITTWQINSTPEWLINQVKKSDGWILSLENISKFTERAAVLREISYKWADVVVLHIHMFDPIPVMAYGIGGGPPVLFMNHADHVFWIGSSIVDELINFRQAGEKLSCRRRDITSNSILPLPLKLPDKIYENKNMIREKLGIDKKTVILLTIATPTKFRTSTKIHFIDILKEVLNRYNNVVSIIIGPNNSGVWEEANKETNGRILAVGIQEDIDKYYAIADIYVDSYMFGSITSALDGGLYNLPIAALQNFYNETLSFNDVSYKYNNNQFYYKKDFINYISKLIIHESYRKEEGKELSIQIKKHHTYKWLEYLNKIYMKIDNKVHKVHINDKFENEVFNEDLILALFQQKKIYGEKDKPLIFPDSIPKSLTEVRSVSIKEDIMIKMQPLLHKNAIKKIRSKSVVKVAFFATHSSVWKYDEVYQLMQHDVKFDPIVVVCPIVNYGKENMIIEMEKTYVMFKRKGFNVIKTYNIDDDTYINIKKQLSPDIIFYTNPHYGLIKDEYYITNFKETLTCYTQYSFHVTHLNEIQYNQLFHNLVWKAFYETTIHEEIAQQYARNKGKNVIITGYSGVDSFNYGSRVGKNVWKNSNENLKRIIWAPHHSIDNRENLNYSNFIKYAETMLNLAWKYRAKIQIAFKPHPLLKVKLYNHNDWGKERTDNYYNQWSKFDNTQLETDDYIDLFNSSDAMIFDSASFITEYLFCGKPSLFTFSDQNVNDRLNEFGKLAIGQHYHAYNETQVEKFIIYVVCQGKDIMKKKRKEFYNQYLKIKNSKSASENIFNYLVDVLFRS